MVPSEEQEKKGERIIRAFQAEDPPFVADPVQDVFTYQGRVGVRATNSSACHLPGKVKRAYYVEGTHFEMGYLLGLMAEPEISQMCHEFNRRVIFEFVDVHVQSEVVATGLGELLERLLHRLSKNIEPDIPAEYVQELRGVLEGCKKANPETRVDWQELWVLNVGVDALLSYVYTGNMPFPADLPYSPKPEQLAVPILCNGFSVSGPAVEGDGHFLGRDFMFPTAGVFQDTACLIVHNPLDPGAGKRQPFVSQTAPGMVGCIAGMNRAGLGAGVDMAPAGNCDPSRPGFNSLLLVRHAVENGTDCEHAVELMEVAQRGVSWNYILAHHGTQRACVVEAGRKVETSEFLDSVTENLEMPSDDPSFEQLPDQVPESLPDRSFVEAQMTSEFRKGLMVRWNDYAYPQEYLRFNERLFGIFGKQYDPDAFTERGYIDRSWKDRNCPYGYYFAPQRENDPNLVLVTNMFIIPEMRLYAMHPWTNLVSASQLDDLQWRYDELNHQLLSKLYPTFGGSPVPLSLEDAKDLIDYLTPNPDKGKHPEYYNPSPEPARGFFRRLWAWLRNLLTGRGNTASPGADWRSIQIEGSVSLMDLKEKTIHSHYGYHGDGWVTIHLEEYL
jgi:hypothetical protein